MLAACIKGAHIFYTGTTSSSSTSDPGVSVSATASSYGRPKLKRESRRPRSRLTSTLYSYPTMYSPVIRHAESETSSEFFNLIIIKTLYAWDCKFVVNEC